MMTSRKFRTRLLAAFTPDEKTQIAAPYLKAGEKYDDSFFQDYFDGKISPSSASAGANTTSSPSPIPCLKSPCWWRIAWPRST